MCLMLYIGCDQDIPLRKGKYLTIEVLPDNEKKVAQWFDAKHVYFIGSHSGCSCGFPHVVAEEPIYYFDGMSDLEAGHYPARLRARWDGDKPSCFRAYG